MDISSRVTNHLKKICEPGSRPIGSAANHKAAAYIQEVFLTCGLVVHEQEFACPHWQLTRTELVANGKPLQAEANTFSPPCNEPKECKVYSPRRDQKIVRLLEEKNPQAIITVNPQIHAVAPVIEDWDLLIPSVTVSPDVGLQLMNVKQPVRVVVVSHRDKSHGSNIIGTKGTRERIVLCAHYDTKVKTQGAFDNGSGVAVLLTLAELLTQRELATDMEFIAFNDEEYNGLGDYEYVRHTSEFESIHAVINIDGVGHFLGSHTVTIMENSQALRDVVSSTKEKYPGIVWVDPWPQSNHSTFSRRGVPSMAVSSVGVDIAHSPLDTVERISADKLAEVVMFITDIVDASDDKPLAWFRKSKKEGTDK
ncbi:MAG: hypothetical protein AYK19_18055 [Theionarchaea archaeon DG-70-1]|nr:MAG: hypothetical protein AYK19_18055 [Theionarchaea archaeon DG-70-1]